MGTSNNPTDEKEKFEEKTHNRVLEGGVVVEDALLGMPLVLVERFVVKEEELHQELAARGNLCRRDNRV